MNKEQLYSVIRQLALVAAGAGPVAAAFHRFGLNPADLPGLVEVLLGICGGIASFFAIIRRSKTAIVVQAQEIVKEDPGVLMEAAKARSGVFH